MPARHLRHVRGTYAAHVRAARSLRSRYARTTRSNTYYPDISLQDITPG